MRICWGNDSMVVFDVFVISWGKEFLFCKNFFLMSCLSSLSLGELHS